MENGSQEHFEDSYDQAKISSLKRQITLSKSQLFELVNDDDKFHGKLTHFNEQGFRCIQKEDFYQAIVYLSEAELTLEYAASCGKTIDRSLILAILHNLACVYQRIWELQKSADYIEGIIYNISSFLESDDKVELSEEVLDDKSVETYKLGISLHSKLRLVCYYLQFCAVNSQLKRHENSLNAAAWSLDILKQICEEEHEYESFMGMRYHSELQRSMLVELRNIKDFKDEVEDVDKNLQRFMNKAKKSIGMFQKKIKFRSELLQQKQVQQLQQFSIGSIMQIFPVEAPQVYDRKWLREELTPFSKIYKALYISIAHFTMATELRLIASNLYPNDQHSKKNSTEFKSSQLHHLVAIITVALYVPYETVYFEHILNSHKNHYQTDLALLSQSTLSEELSHTVQQDDEIHLQISSLYRKKHKQVSSSHNNKQKSEAKLIEQNSPSVHSNAGKKGKIKTSKSERENTSVKRKCRMITDSQKGKGKGKSQGKSYHKKSKSKKKVESRNKDLSSPNSHTKITSMTTLGDIPPKHPAASRSKSKYKKKQSKGKATELAHQKSRDKLEKVRSEQQYDFRATGHISRTGKQQKKRSLKSSQRSSQLKRSNGDSRQQARFVRQHRSPNAIPRPVK